MITTDIAGKIQQQIGQRVSVSQRDAHVFDVSTPFLFADGDHYGFVVSRERRGKWQLSDEGEVIEKARIAGVDLLAAGRSERLTHALDFYGLKEREGELVMTAGESEFGEAFFNFAQACLEISRLTSLPSHRAKPAKRASLVETVEGLVKSALPTASFERAWHHPELDPHGIYAVDFNISAAKKPLLVFAPETDMECLQATVSCQHYRQKQFHFDSLAVIDESRHLVKRNVIALTDATASHVPADDADEVREVLRKKAG